MQTQQLVILTGASRGLGAALARQLISPETRLICVARTPNDALGELAKARKGWLDYYLADLTDAEQAHSLAESICSAIDNSFSRYVLINNAGMVGPLVRSAHLGVEDIVPTLQLNVVAAMLFMSSFLRATQGVDGARRVINISSGAARNPISGATVYSMSKAALDMATRGAHEDEKGTPNPALLVSLAPGVIETDMQSILRDTDAEDFASRQRFVDLKANDQLATPEAAAARVLAFLDRPDFGTRVIADVRDA